MAEIRAALDWLKCDDLAKIRNGEGATQRSVKDVTKELVDAPFLALKTNLSVEQLRTQWRSDHVEKALKEKDNKDTRRTFLEVVNRVKEDQTKEQAERREGADKKREEKNKLAAIQRAELQSQRNQLHDVLKKNHVYLLAICPLVDHGLRYSKPTTADKSTKIVEAKLKDRACVAYRFKGSSHNHPKFDFLFDTIDMYVFHAFFFS